MEFVFRKDDGGRFEGAWSSFIQKDNFSGFYSLKFIDTMRLCSKSLKEDLSFAAMEGGSCVAIAPLFLEEADGRRQFTYGGSWLRSPICSSQDAEKKVFERIDKLAQESGVGKAMMMVEPSWWLQAEDKYNRLQKHGFLDASISTNVIDLAPPEDALLRRMRHGHESVIKSRMKDFLLTVVDHKNPDFNLHEQYRQTHHKDAGRVTRPMESFSLQFDTVKADEAALFCLDHKGKKAAFAYFYHGKTSAYYGSAAMDPDFTESNGAYHWLMWEAIRYYKKRGLKHLETGWQQFGPQIFDQPSEKDISISLFKRGFGGANIPLMRGVKYYDKALLEKEVAEAASRLSGQERKKA